MLAPSAVKTHTTEDDLPPTAEEPAEPLLKLETNELEVAEAWAAEVWVVEVWAAEEAVGCVADEAAAAEEVGETTAVEDVGAAVLDTAGVELDCWTIELDSGAALEVEIEETAGVDDVVSAAEAEGCEMAVDTSSTTEETTSDMRRLVLGVR